LEAAHEYVISVMDGINGLKRNWEKIDQYTRSAQCSQYVELVKKLV